MVVEAARTTRSPLLVGKDLWVEEIVDQKWEDIESATCELKVDQKKIMLACIYRPTTASDEVNEQLQHAILKMCELASNQILICGDFNFKGIDWENNIVDSDSNQSRGQVS